MKLPIIATILLVLAVPAFAADDYNVLPPAQQVDPFAQPMYPEYKPKEYRPKNEPVSAVEWPGSVTVRRDIDNFERSHGVCVYRKRDDPDNPGEEIKKACADADELEKKLTAQGYCIYGKGTVGQPSKDGKHCYEGIDNRIRHDRICDFVQDRAHDLYSFYNPEGGNAVMFSKCEVKITEDSPVGDPMYRSGWWGALSCGYRAYREGKKLKDNPYKNSAKIEGWERGWKVARKSCATGRPPFTKDDDDIK